MARDGGEPVDVGLGREPVALADGERGAGLQGRGGVLGALHHLIPDLERTVEVAALGQQGGQSGGGVAVGRVGCRSRP